MAKVKKACYVVWEGRIRGLFLDWEECKTAVMGVPGAKYKGFDTLEEGEKAFDLGYAAYYASLDTVENGVSGTLASSSSKANSVSKTPILSALSVDAACSGNPGKMEFQGVWVETRTCLFREGPFMDGTNNVGEFFALVTGLKFLHEHQNHAVIYTDSKTAMAWVRKKKCGSKLKKTSKNHILFDKIAEAEFWLKTHKYSTKILKWETKLWGEIPADFGRK